VENGNQVEAELKRRRERFFRSGCIESASSSKPRVSFSGALSLP
jgi:hypothetical protein